MLGSQRGWVSSIPDLLYVLPKFYSLYLMFCLNQQTRDVTVVVIRCGDHDVLSEELDLALPQGSSVLGGDCNSLISGK